ncbi:MAG TPA: hypothetical protein ACFYED_06670 [Candidatus Tripitaka californicus]|jgi:hypothetical protein|uniref:hypothetical protein n=1 Tax=Candidatus Tripitaka californicus TaxID=3367616 RepID=UPI004029DA7E
MEKWLKPVRKCSGCKLNLGERCAVFPSPREKWRHGLCSGYNNVELINKYQEEIAKHPPKVDKVQRKKVAGSRGTVEHHQGKSKVSTLRSVH